MFSGKSTELIRLVRRSRIIGKKVMVVNHRMDNRYSEEESVVSHAGQDIPSVKVNKLSELEGIGLEQPDIIAIDEAQFFEDLTEQVMHFVEDLGIKVIVAGLSGDYQRNPFGNILELVPKCDHLVFTHAYCSSCNDGTHAAFTKRLVQEEGQTLVGDKTKYAAVCRECYINSP
jgi:thymidine kinase